MTLLDVMRMTLATRTAPVGMILKKDDYLGLVDEVKAKITANGGGPLWVSEVGLVHNWENYTPPSVMVRGIKFSPEEPT